MSCCVGYLCDLFFLLAITTFFSCTSKLAFTLVFISSSLWQWIKLTSNNTISGNVITAITKISGGTQSCSSKSVYNPTNSVKYYSWVNCTGGTETGYTVSPNQTVEICANSVTPLPILGQGLIVGDGNLNCSDAITDGKISVSVGFNGPSISNDCSVLIVQTPQPQQLYSQLYSPIYYGNSYS